MPSKQGIPGLVHLLTEEDVLLHCYGVIPGFTEPSPSDEAPLPAEDPPADFPADEDPPVEDPPAGVPVEDPPAEDPPADVPAEPEEKESEEPAPTVEQMAAKLEHDHTKAELVAMAEQAGVDSSGNKADLSARLAAHYASL